MFITDERINLYLHLERVRDDEDDGGDVNDEDEGHGRHLAGPLVVGDVHCSVPVHGDTQQAQAWDVDTRTLTICKLWESAKARTRI